MDMPVDLTLARALEDIRGGCDEAVARMSEGGCHGQRVVRPREDIEAKSAKYCSQCMRQPIGRPTGQFYIRGRFGIASWQ